MPPISVDVKSLQKNTLCKQDVLNQREQTCRQNRAPVQQGRATIAVQDF